MLSYYLDYYPGLRDNITFKTVRHEFIGIYIYSNPQTKEEIQYNKEMKRKAEAIRCRRYEEVVNEKFGLFDERKLKGDFLAYYRKTMEGKNVKWQFVYAHFEKFVHGKCRFIDVDVELCKKFHDYLLKAKGLKSRQPLARNSVQIEFITKNNYHLKGYYYFNFSYFGRSDGFGDYYEEVENSIKKYGIFAYLPIYKRINWDFDLVEKYKDSIIWPELMAKSNLEWSEEMLYKYEHYIHFCNKNADTYCEKFFNVFDNYNSLGFLSNDFLEKHKEVLNWEKVIQCCKFQWNAEELTYFCSYFLSCKMPYSKEYFLKDVTVESQLRYNLRYFFLNNNFIWNADNLFALIKLDGGIIDSIAEHKHLYNYWCPIKN